MIQNQATLQFYNRQQEELTREILEYKRINASLKKKIQSRDKKITYLFSCMDPMARSTPQYALENSVIKKNKSQVENIGHYKKDVNFTEPKHKQKQNLMQPNLNIFKNMNPEAIDSYHRLNFRLPALQRKNIFAEDPQVITQPRPKIIKVPIEKLIPLKPQDVKKKFESKFK